MIDIVVFTQLFCFLMWLSYRALGGTVAPDSWQGGLNFTYHIGPGFTNASWYVKKVLCTVCFHYNYLKLKADQMSKLLFKKQHQILLPQKTCF